MKILPMLATLALLLAVQPAQGQAALAPDQVATSQSPPVLAAASGSSSLLDDCRLEPMDGEMQLRCGETYETCGVVQRPLCWTVRFACYYTEYQFERAGVRCHTQPDCCPESGLQEAAAPRSASDSGLADEQCESTNYGVRTDLNVLSTNCSGSCTNHGVWFEVTVESETSCGTCSNTGIELRLGPSCRGPFFGACAGTDCVEPCRTCPGLASTGTSSSLEAQQGWWDCLVVVQAPSLVSNCDPCADDANPLLVVGMVSCHQNCVNEGVQATVGLYDCGACGKEGVTVFVGQHCEEWGVGACVGYCCYRPVSSSGQPLYDPCFIGPRWSLL